MRVGGLTWRIQSTATFGLRELKKKPMPRPPSVRTVEPRTHAIERTVIGEIDLRASAVYTGQTSFACRSSEGSRASDAQNPTTRGCRHADA